MPKLISASGHTLDLPAPPFRVGTDQVCEVPMQQGLGIAAIHFTVSLDEKGFVLEDGGSGLGTFLNGKAVKKERLLTGDCLRFGQIELRFEVAMEE